MITIHRFMPRAYSLYFIPITLTWLCRSPWKEKHGLKRQCLTTRFDVYFSVGCTIKLHDIHPGYVAC